MPDSFSSEVFIVLGSSSEKFLLACARMVDTCWEGEKGSKEVVAVVVGFGFARGVWLEHVV